MANRKQAEAMLDRLIELDYQTVEAYYDMGSIISSMQHGRIWEILEYNSMTHLVEEELTFTPTTAFKYATMYRHFRRLHYIKHEAIDLLKRFGLSHMCDVLPKMKDKIGVRAIKKRIDAIDELQVNFTLHGGEVDELRQALRTMGARPSENGRWADSSIALLRMAREINKNQKPKLQAVK